ncbi:class I SAM-dependent methyltransferase [Kribbella deserti]|uniref:Class I SAM-dependent methyltransferase n=1 Tax=Kribbella deserti TaxID=1926257 RepID=A0ABV6QJG3_9ACTN
MSPTLSHPLFARIYVRLRPTMDSQGVTEHRRQLLEGLTGRVVEVGAGDGGNFPFYPAGVTGVVAIEPDPYLRAKATQAAAEASADIKVVEGLASELPVDAGTVDAVVMCLVLCSVEDQGAALDEAFRVLRPGGELRFYEHVAAQTGTRLARVQRIADATLWPRLMGGCHLGRDTVSAIGAAGFLIDELERFAFPPDKPSPASPHAMGRATRPA